jgi:hypothetical protein
MLSPLTVTLQDIERSGVLEARVREVGQRLRRNNSSITQCHMTVVGGLDDRADGAPFAVKIHASVPGAEIHADSIQVNGAGHSDIYGALWDAYMSARSQLQDLQRERKSSLLSRARQVIRVG